MKRFLVTGGTGFLGSALVHRLVSAGHFVRVLDNNLRGTPVRLQSIKDEIELVEGDITKFEDVLKASENIDTVCHLAYLNGTEFFYSKPELVLEIAVKGMIHVLDACKHHGIKDLVLASSSEVYQTPPSVPTDETVALSVPDPLNPRYSYGGGKIISELLALNYGRKYFDRVTIFRPHNVYGPDMGWEHVVPQLVLKLVDICDKNPNQTIELPIQGTGLETRAFIYVDDFISGLMTVIEQGKHMEIYNIGVQEEVTIQSLAQMIAQNYGKKANVVAGKAAKGATSRRCPDVSKLKKLGFEPKISLLKGLKRTLDWYIRHSDQNPKVKMRSEENVPHIYK